MSRHTSTKRHSLHFIEIAFVARNPARTGLDYPAFVPELLHLFLVYLQ